MASDPETLSNRTAELAAPLLFAAILLAWSAARLPATARFECFQFQDYGANLSVQALVDLGERPGIDFFYPYGLLPLAVGRAWFGVWGRTPWAYLGLVAVLQTAIGLLMGRLLTALRGGWPTMALVAVSLPIVVPPSYPNLAHGLEAVLLLGSLAALARHGPHAALAWAIAAAFTKPSMGYVAALLYGLMAIRQGGFRNWGWPVLAAGVLTVGLGAWQGQRVLRHTLFPLGTATHYRAAGYGFFHGSGRDFWWPPQARLAHYLATPRLFWLAASGCLLGASLWGLVANRRAGLTRAGAVVGIAAIMHVTFVTLFFGNALSWQYYAYLLPAGLIPLGSACRGGRVVVLALACLGLLVDRTLPREIGDTWRGASYQRAGPAEGLWSTAELAREWGDFEAGPAADRAVLVSMSGAADVLDAGLTPPVGLFLLPGLETGPIGLRLAGQVAAADVVIVTGPGLAPAGFDRLISGETPLGRALKAFRVDRQGRYFRRLVRAERAGSAPVAAVPTAADPAP